MKSEEKTQPTDLSVLSRSELEKRYLNLETEYKSALAKKAWYEEQYKLAQQRRYGKSSEQNITGQMSVEDYGVPLFNEAEACREPINAEPKAEDLDTEDKPKKRRRKKDVTPLPVVETVYELSEEEKVCPNCGSPLHEMKRTVRTEIEVIPAKVQVHCFVCHRALRLPQLFQGRKARIYHRERHTGCPDPRQHGFRIPSGGYPYKEVRAGGSVLPAGEGIRGPWDPDHPQ